MLRNLILKRLDVEERKLGGVSLDYLRHIARTSLPAFFKFALFTPLASHRRRLPPDAYHVARLVATKHEDCGTCVQIEVNLARRAGVAADVLRAALTGRPDELPADLADVYHFARSVVEAGDEEGSNHQRERVRARYGEEALVEMALAIAAARVFPTTKRALGYATSCALVRVEL
jgi:alkylhydroperoxidase family enzyme